MYPLHLSVQYNSGRATVWPTNDILAPLKLHNLSARIVNFKIVLHLCKRVKRCRQLFAFIFLFLRIVQTQFKYMYLQALEEFRTKMMISSN